MRARKPAPHRSYRFALLMLAMLGAVVGLFTGLQATRTVLVGPARVSVGGLAAFVLTAALGLLAGWSLRSRDAAFTPGAGWFVAVLGLLFAPHPGGDIVLPGSGGDAVEFVLLGIVGTILAGLIASRLLPPGRAGDEDAADAAVPPPPDPSPPGRRRR